MLGLNFVLDSDGLTAARIFIEHRQYFQRAAFIRPIENKIPSPHLGGQTGRDPMARYTLGFGTDLKTFFAADTLDLLATNRPALLG